MRQNLQKASAAQRDGTGMGPIYRYLLNRETSQQRRFGQVGNMRRPRHLLDALERRETVEVASWRVPIELRPPDYGQTLIVTPDM